MGRDKASLPFGGGTLLGHTVGRLRGLVHEVVVVARPGQEVPELPSGVVVARDETPDLGPLGGIVPGLRALRAEAAFVTGCDFPWVRREVVDLLFARLPNHDAVVPRAEGFLQPLCAVYRRSVLEAAQALLVEGRLRPVFLLSTVRGFEVSEEELRAVDPDLDSLRNLNTPEAYEAALRRLFP